MFLFACKKSDENTNSNFTASIDGTSFKSQTTLVNTRAFPGMVSITGTVNNGEEFIELNFPNQIGTFTANKDTTTALFKYHIVTGINKDLWTTTLDTLGGKVVVTNYTPTNITGTFSFSCKNRDTLETRITQDTTRADTLRPSYKKITSGSFNINY
jgi:uncharacterized protein YmfQ (DUF2313 family)